MAWWWLGSGVTTKGQPDTASRWRPFRAQATSPKDRCFCFCPCQKSARQQRQQTRSVATLLLLCFMVRSKHLRVPCMLEGTCLSEKRHLRCMSSIERRSCSTCQLSKAWNGAGLQHLESCWLLFCDIFDAQDVSETTLAKLGRDLEPAAWVQVQAGSEGWWWTLHALCPGPKANIREECASTPAVVVTAGMSIGAQATTKSSLGTCTTCPSHTGLCTTALPHVHHVPTNLWAQAAQSSSCRSSASNRGAPKHSIQARLG